MEEIEKEEEQKREKLDFYLNPENWLHLSSEILANGRMTKEELEFTEDVDEDAKEIIKKEIYKLLSPSKRLKSITKDQGELISRKTFKMLVMESNR